MSEDSGIEPPVNPVTASDDDAMFPGIDKLIVENDLPLRMYELTVTKRHKGIARWMSPRLFGGEIFEGFRQLQHRHEYHGKLAN
jgi:hypothetical protein